MTTDHACHAHCDAALLWRSEALRSREALKLTADTEAILRRSLDAERAEVKALRAEAKALRAEARALRVRAEAKDTARSA